MDHSRCSSQRRPRLLRASATEPSIITSSIVNHGALDMSQPMSPSNSGRRDGSAGTGGGYRRATDLLNHVAYLSSCTTSPVSPIGSGPFFERVMPRRFRSGDGSSGDGSRGRAGSSTTDPGRSDHHHHHRTSTPTGTTPALPESNRGGHGSRATRRSSDDEGAGHHDDLLGSSPASTHTSGSLDRLHRHHSLSSAHYVSFPSFDTWDPDRQDKEDDDDD